MADLITPVAEPNTLTATALQLDDVGSDIQLSAYDHMIRPSFVNIVGSGTLKDGGYIGRMLAVYREHIYDMKQKKEITSADAGKILGNVMPTIISECIGFEVGQIHHATQFTNDLLGIEASKLDVQLKNIALQSDVFSHTNLNPIKRVKAMEDVQSVHSQHRLTEAELALKNIEAGGNGIDTTINSATSMIGHRMKESEAKVNIDKVIKSLKVMEAGGDGTNDNISYKKSLVYLNRMQSEAKLGNSGNGVDLGESIYKWDAERSKITAKHESIRAGGNGDDILINAENSSEYLKKQEIKARLGDTGNGIRLNDSVYHWDNVKASISTKMESIKAGGNGDDILVNADKSLPYYQKLEVSSKLGDRGNGINLNDSLFKYQSDKLHAEAALESVKAGGDGVNVISNPLKALPHFQILDITSRLGDVGDGVDLVHSHGKLQTDKLRAEIALASIQAGGNANDIIYDATNTEHYFRVLEMKSKLGDEGDGTGINLGRSIGKYQTDYEMLKARHMELQRAGLSISEGGNGNDVVFDATKSTSFYKRESAKYLSETEETNTNIAKLKQALTSIEAGGSGVGTNIDRVQSAPYMTTLFKKMQALSEMQRGGYTSLTETESVNDQRSMVTAQRESMIVQKNMYRRQTEAFDDRKLQSVLDATLKYNMMVFPDNTHAGDMIPTRTDKEPIDSLIATIVGS